ncbi:hypothetical protein Ate02nite_80360 [Paractinoplanes tereljensis]|uniref:RING-type E3 ubiquitin transferase n=2 Tax=Paractinoplanes tereljensis TaxID=571912 RepID=A0A919NU54_9ACTN|nr:hypothetical protein Ate02nite_80360 [Actinoplanes tereljensis]
MVLVTGIFALISIGDLRMSRLLRRTVPAPLGSWPARGRVSAEAVTEYGPAGPQIGPLSGEDCTWYEMTIVRDDGENRSDVYLDGGKAPAWPALADATGRVTLDPRLLVDGRGQALTYHASTVTESSTESWRKKRGETPPAWATPKIARSTSNGDVLQLQEVRLPRGREVFVMGRAANGSVRPMRRAFVTPERWADMIAAKESDQRLMTVTMPIFIVVGVLVAAAGFGLLLLVTR